MLDITITREGKNKFNVNYQKTIDGNLIEIEGTLIPYNSGRADELRFEPNYFTDENSEYYYDNNWEDIESQILIKLSLSKH